MAKLRRGRLEYQAFKAIAVHFCLQRKRAKTRLEGTCFADGRQHENENEKQKQYRGSLPSGPIGNNYDTDTILHRKTTRHGIVETL